MPTPKILTVPTSEFVVKGMSVTSQLQGFTKTGDHLMKVHRFTEWLLSELQSTSGVTLDRFGASLKAHGLDRFALVLEKRRNTYFSPDSVATVTYGDAIEDVIDSHFKRAVLHCHSVKASSGYFPVKALMTTQTHLRGQSRHLRENHKRCHHVAMWSFGQFLLGADVVTIADSRSHVNVFPECVMCCVPGGAE